MREKITDTLLKTLKTPSKDVELYDTVETGFSVISRPSGVKSFRLRYRNQSAQKRTFNIGSWGKLTVKQARDVAGKLNGQIANGIDVQTEKKSKRVAADREQKQTLGIFFETEYKPYLLANMKRGKERVYLLEHYFVDDWGTKSLYEVNNWLVSNWRRKKLQGGMSHSGINRPVSALKAMLNRAVEWDLIEGNPLSSVKPLKEDNNPIVRHLDAAEEKVLRRALDRRQEQQKAERHRYNSWLASRGKERLAMYPDEFTDYLKPLVLVALNTGLRRGELFDLELRDVDLKKAEIRIRAEVSKSSNSRRIPMNTECAETLKGWIEQTKQSALVFPSPVTGRRFDNIATAWSGLMKLSKVQDFRFHDLRHTFASKLVMRGVDLYTVKDLLGHASVETTQRYAHLAPEHKAKAVELLND